MIEAGIKVDDKAGFFDREAVIKDMDKKTAKALSRFGAFVRTTARKSLKYKDGTSAPGDPPFVHKGMKRTKRNRKTGEEKAQDVSPLRELLYFAYDKVTKSVVIGPVPFKGKSDAAKLEAGGDVTVKNRDGGTVVYKIRKRPFMVPAFEKELPNAAELWAT